MNLFIYIFTYYLVTTFMGILLLIFRYSKENPNVNVLVYCLMGAMFGWLLTPIIIIGYIFKGFVFGIGCITIKICDWFNI